MLKKLGIPTLALTIAMAVAAPAVTLARGRDDQRGGGAARHEVYRGREGRDDRGWRDRDGGRFNFGVGVYTAPAPAPAGYYDQYGIWHPYVYGPYGRYR
jgi:hypothetical protein